MKNISKTIYILVMPLVLFLTTSLSSSHAEIISYNGEKKQKVRYITNHQRRSSQSSSTQSQLKTRNHASIDEKSTTTLYKNHREIPYSAPIAAKHFEIGINGGSVVQDEDGESTIYTSGLYIGCLYHFNDVIAGATGILGKYYTPEKIEEETYSDGNIVRYDMKMKEIGISQKFSYNINPYDSVVVSPFVEGLAAIGKITAEYEEKNIYDSSYGLKGTGEFDSYRFGGTVGIQLNIGYFAPYIKYEISELYIKNSMNYTFTASNGATISGTSKVESSEKGDTIKNISIGLNFLF